jgi:hypothetical protein
VPTYHQKVTHALDALAGGLAPYIEQELRTIYGGRWESAARESFRSGRGRTGDEDATFQWDAHAGLTVMWDQWNSVFRHRLTHQDRSLVSELREFRNRWAHQAEFDFDDTYRILDSAARLLQSVGSPRAADVARAKQSLFRTEFDRQARAAYNRSRASRKVWQDVLTYVGCAAAMIAAIVQGYGWTAWFMIVVVVGVFGVIVWQRMAAPPVFFGAHECVDCGKIIYVDHCPYCEPPARPRPVEQPAGEAAQRAAS